MYSINNNNNIEDINACSFLNEPHITPTQPSTNNNNNNTDINNNKDEIHFSVVSFLDDKIEVTPNNNNPNESYFYTSILDEMKCLDQRNISMIESDYLRKRRIYKPTDNELKQMLKEVTSEGLAIMKSDIDKQEYSGSSVAPLSTLLSLINKYYSNNNTSKYIISEKLSNYMESSIYRWRPLRSDANSYYRSVMFCYLEKLIVEYRKDEFNAVIYDLYKACNDKYFCEKLYYVKVSKDILLILAFLIMYALGIKDVNDAKNKAYAVLVKSFNNVYDFEYGMIMYCKYTLRQYISQNEGMLFSKETPINVNNLLPENYQSNGNYYYTYFYEQSLMVLNKEVDKMVVYITPFVFGVTLSVVMSNFTQNDCNVYNSEFKCISDGDGSKGKDCLMLMFRNGLFDVVYSKEWYMKYKDVLDVYVENSLRNANANMQKKYKQQKYQSGQNMNSNNNNNGGYRATQQIKQQKLNTQETGEFGYQSQKLPIVKNNILFNNQPNQQQQQQQQKQLQSQNNNSHNNSYNNIYYQPPQQQQQPQHTSYCKKCHVQPTTQLLCDECHIAYIKTWLKDNYKLFLLANITNITKLSNTNIKLIPFETAVQKIYIPYDNTNIKLLFEDAVSKLNLEYQCNINDFISKIQNTICISCYKVSQNFDNISHIKLPCGCTLCNVECLCKYLVKLPLNTFQQFACVCGKVYNFIQMKYMFYLIKANNIKELDMELFKDIICKYYITKCAKCLNDSNSNKDGNVIELNDVEMNMMFNIEKFNHYICKKCYNNNNSNSNNSSLISEDKKFICNLCNGCHNYITNI